MKKYLSILFVFALFITLLGFNVNVASADFTPGCTSESQVYSLTTGQLCNTVSLTQNLQIGSRGSGVTILQRFLKAEGYFFGIIDGRYGRITARAVGDFQEDTGLPRTETVNAVTRAKINAAIASGSMEFDTTNLPAGCTSTQGYSPTTGVKCDSLVVPPTVSLPVGCTSTQGYSSVTGVKCDSVVLHPSLPPGCTSASGFSPITGEPCGISTPVYPDGCTSFIGFSTTTGMSCSGGTTQPSITVISPNGGEVLKNDTDFNIKWTLPVDKRYMTSFYLIPDSNTPYNHTDPYGIRGYDIGGTSLNNPTSPVSVPFTFSNIPNGKYKLRAYLTVFSDEYRVSPLNAISFDESDRLFTITAPTTQPLTITTSSPIPNAKVGQAYSVNLTATGGSSGITYNWVMPTCGGCSSLPSGLSLSLTGNISGTPVQAGIYNFYIAYSSGYPLYQAVQKQFTLTIDPATTTTPSITVLSPNGGEVWQTGSSQTIRWNVGDSSISQVNLTLRKVGFTGATNDLYLQTPNSGSLTFIVPSSYPTGTFFLRVEKTDGTLLDESNSYFTITSPTTTPSITVLSPNGGETLIIGEEGRVGFSAIGLAGRTVNIFASNADTNLDTQLIIGSRIDVDGAKDDFFLLTNLMTPGTRYKIKLRAVDSNNTLLATDLSDNYFTITTAPTVICAADVQQCSDGSYVSRDPNNSCQFKICPKTYIKQVSTTGSGSLAANVINTINVQTTGNVIVAEKFQFSQFLSEGSYGNEVKELQKFLNGAGYDVGNIDGVFGSKVKEGLIKFQIANKLKGDGIVGYEVRMFLNK